jgi:hypothetical protein
LSGFRISLAVESEKFLSVARESHVDVAFQFIGVERVRRLAELEHHKV